VVWSSSASVRGGALRRVTGDAASAADLCVRGWSEGPVWCVVIFCAVLRCVVSHCVGFTPEHCRTLEGHCKLFFEHAAHTLCVAPCRVHKILCVG
jgi:hypothetical protein